MKTLIRLIVVTGLVAAPHVAFAQAQLVPSEIKTVEKTDVQGWAPFLGLTSTLALASNSSVVGQVDGFSTLFGLGVTGGADYVDGKHLVRSSLSINESFARTPVIDEFVKTNDVVKLEGLYHYFLTKTFGLYGRLDFTTGLFKTTDVRGEATSWVEKVPGGMNIPLTTNGFRQKLASSFAPFTINESGGAFYEPLHKPKITLAFRGGIGGRHTFADGVLVNDDASATPEIELSRLRNVHQLGAEAFAGAHGKFKDGKASYKAGLSILFPFVNNDKDNRSTSELTRVGFEGSLNFNIYSWMSLVYNLNITRDPQLFPKGDEQIQIKNSLLLTFQFTLVKKPEKPKEPTKEELELKAAQERADAAEKRALEAEQKAQQPPAPAPEPAPAPAPAPTPAPAPPTPTPTPAPAPAAPAPAPAPAAPAPTPTP
jgi:hypothetical protein